MNKYSHQSIKKHHQVKLISVLGHQSMYEKENADECAISESYLYESVSSNEVLNSLVVVANINDD